MKFFIDTEFHEYEKEAWKNEMEMIKVPTIELISIGIVAEDGREYYAVSNEFDLQAAWNNEWLRENVLPNLLEVPGVIHAEYAGKDTYVPTIKDAIFAVERIGKTRKQIRNEILEFIGPYPYAVRQYSENGEFLGELPPPKPEFYGYFSDYDWVVFCWLFGRMIDLPKHFPMFCYDLQQTICDVTTGLKNRGFDFDIRTLPDYPKQENEHNALADGRWVKRLWDYLKSKEDQYFDELEAVN
jgi:hypothetical protein